MNRRFALLAALATTLIVAASGAIGAANPETTVGALKPEPQFAVIEQAVVRELQRYHYERRPIDDAFSAAAFDAYLKRLDPSRSFLLMADVTDLRAKYGLGFDDALVRNDLRPAYAIFQVYAQRSAERIAFAMSLLDQPIDLAAKDEYAYDRSDAPWLADSAEADRLWVKRVKNDLINVQLSGSTDAAARDTLRKRYQNLLNRSQQVKSSDVFEFFMDGLTSVYDPHTNYFGPRDAEEFKISMGLKYEGIGAALQLQDEYVQVARILPGGSAARSGLLHEQDRVLAIGQGPDFSMVDVMNWRLDDVVALIRGPKGTEVRLRIFPVSDGASAAEKTITLSRDEIKLDDRAAKKEIIEVKRPEGSFKVGVIHLPSFYEDFDGRNAGDSDYTSTTRDVRKLIDELKTAKVAGIVIDLRDNGGGSLPEAVDLTGLFIDRGPVVQVRNTFGQVGVYEDKSPGTAYDGPLMVVVNRFSASASEIFAGAMQDYGRALVVGQTTYGKGTFQGLQHLNERIDTKANLCGNPTCPELKVGDLKFTAGKFYRITGSSTQHKGVVPDVELPSVIDPKEFGESSQPNALAWDMIGTTDFKGVKLATGLTDRLTRAHDERIAHDKEFQQFEKDVDEAKAANAKGTVSLVLTERIAERDRIQAERLAEVNQQRATRGQQPLAKLSDAPPKPGEEGPDPLLDESAQILVDAVNLTGGGSLAQLVTPRSGDGKRKVPAQH